MEIGHAALLRLTRPAAANEGSATPTSHAAPHADLAARSAARPAARSMCARRPRAMLAGELADPGEEALGGRNTEPEDIVA